MGKLCSLPLHPFVVPAGPHGGADSSLAQLAPAVGLQDVHGERLLHADSPGRGQLSFVLHGAGALLIEPQLGISEVLRCREGGVKTRCQLQDCVHFILQLSY